MKGPMTTTPSCKGPKGIRKECIGVILKGVSVVDMAVSCGRMESSLRVSGGRARRTVGGYGNLPKAIAMRVNGGITSKMVAGVTSTQELPSSMAILKIS